MNFNELFEANIKETKAIYDLAELYGKLNEQETLNWLDELNAISIKN